MVKFDSRYYEIKKYYDQIESIIRKYNLQESIGLIQSIVIQLFKEGKAFNEDYEIWSLAFIAQEFFRVSSNSTRSGKIPEHELQHIRYLYYKCSDPIFEKPTSEASYVPTFLFITEYEQLFWQRPIINHLPRTYAFFELCDDDNTVKLNNKFLSKYSISVIDYLLNSFLLFTMVSKSGKISISSVDKTAANLPIYRENFTEDNFIKTVKVMLAEKKQFRMQCERAQLKDPVRYKYRLNLLYKYPIIEIGALDYLIPIPEFILFKASIGFYFTLLEEYELEDKRDEFTNAFGGIFCNYIKRLLSEIEDANTSVLCADDLDFGNYSGKKCDFIVFEGNKIFLIECKSTQISRSVIDSLNHNAITEFIRSRYFIPKGIHQLHEMRPYISAKHPNHDIYSLLLINDSFSNFNRHRLFFNEDDESIRIIDQEKIQIITILEFEALVANYNKLNLCQLFEKKLESLATKESSFFSVMDEFEGFDPGLQPKLLRDIEERIFHWEQLP